MLNNIKESSDGVVQFFEDTHKYVVKKTGQQLISVSTLVKKHFCEEFDLDGKILARCAIKEGIPEKELKQRWEDEKNRSGTYGTELHAEFEYFIKTGEIRDTPHKDIVENFKSIKFNGILKSEEILYDLDYGIAGCTDLIEVVDNQYDIDDFKSNKAIKKFSFGKYMKYPLGHLPDCNYYHYLCQLNIYSYLYEKMSGLWPRNRRLFWINPKTRKIEEMLMEDIRLDVVNMLNHYKKNYLDKVK